MSSTRQLIATATELEELAAGLLAMDDLRLDGRDQVERRVLDTFDWRVYRAGCLLEFEQGTRGGRLVLRDAALEVLTSQPLGDPPTFAVDLPPGPIRDRLGKALGVRALLDRAVTTSTRLVLRHLNDDDKTVARVVVERRRATASHSDLFVSVEPLRGYDRSAARLAARLTERFALAERPRGGLDDAFAALGVVPGQTVDAAHLVPDRPPAAAMAHLLGDLLEVMVANEAGVRDDIDTEFLHDFRVAIRRTRSLLPVAQGCLPAAIDPFLEQFRAFARQTAELRDLDVLLLEFPVIATGVPEEWRDDLAKLEPVIAAERVRARRELLGVLDQSWPSLRDRWRAFLAEAAATGAAETEARDGAPAAVGDASAAEFAQAAIERAHRVVLRAGRRLTERSPAADLHRLRKKAKILRYQLEAFAPALPADELSGALRELRRLQDVLGQFQDYDVQVHTIRHFTDLVTANDDLGADVLLAMGALRAHLREERERERVRAIRAFRRFDTAANRDRYRRLVTTPTTPTTTAPDRTADRGAAPAAATTTGIGTGTGAGAGTEGTP